MVRVYVGRKPTAARVIVVPAETSVFSPVDMEEVRSKRFETANEANLAAQSLMTTLSKFSPAGVDVLLGPPGGLAKTTPPGGL